MSHILLLLHTVQEGVAMDSLQALINSNLTATRRKFICHAMRSEESRCFMKG